MESTHLSDEPEIWQQVTKEQAETFLLNWAKQGQDRKIRQLIEMANILMTW